ncbi:MAG: family 1 glycosylhydrolase [Actinobacteria bacterium]|nr:family 1 glycosylhydrolase [Actinomycetota bacterium]
MSFTAAGPAPIELIGAFESTYLPRHDVDVAETTGHTERWRDDLGLLSDIGVRRLRYPIRWHRVQDTPGSYDWSETDRVLGHLHDNGFRPIVDLVHHTSYPRWLVGGLGDRRFGPAYLRFAEAVARRYPWIEEYTLFNEPFSTLFLCGHEGIWPPYHRGLEGLVAIFENVLPWIGEASRLYRELLPAARHVYVDSCESHTSAGAAGDDLTAMANDRRFFVADALLGRHLDEDRPFVADVLQAGGESLLGMEPVHIDVLGLDYYAHCQWEFHAADAGTVPSPDPRPFRDLIVEYWQRYGLPCMVGETNIRGFASDRASWLKHTLEQTEQAREAGVPIDGFCWFPTIDSADWDSLLFHCDGNIDPVGVFWLDAQLHRRPSSMSRSFALAASGVPARQLPAYRFQPPVSEWMKGFLPYMQHWEWQDPPADEAATCDAGEDLKIELRIRDLDVA